MINDYITVKEAAEKWQLKERTIQEMCNDGRIRGATKFGKSWAIPIDCEKPQDKRVISGNYIGWRKNKKQ